MLHYVAIMDRGGQETFIMNLFRSIDRKKIMFDFLCMISGEGDFDSEISELGGTIYHINLNRIKGKLKQIDNFWLIYCFLKNCKNKYRVFHIHTQHAMDAFLSAMAAKCAGIHTVIVHSHNTNTLFHRKAHFVFRHVLNKLKIERFACSNAAGKWMYDKKQFKVIHNGIIPEMFVFNDSVRNDIRKKFNWSDHYIIGHVGRFNEQKNHDFIIDIFNELHKNELSCKLVLIGQGENYEKICNKIREMGLTEFIDILGVRRDVSLLYQGMDLFLFPSLFEGLPVVLVETQMADLPSLISDSITTEIDITDKISRMGLEEPPEIWAKELQSILHKNNKRGNTTIEIKRAGYDMQDTAQILTELYQK